MVFRLPGSKAFEFRRQFRPAFGRDAAGHRENNNLPASKMTGQLDKPSHHALGAVPSPDDKKVTLGLSKGRLGDHPKKNDEKKKPFPHLFLQRGYITIFDGLPIGFFAVSDTAFPPTFEKRAKVPTLWQLHLWG
jgi:hypothetical protein